MRALLSLLVLLLFALPAEAEIDRAGLVRLGRSVLKIEVIRAQGGYALGSGVVVAAHKVVTNCHVTREAQEIHVLRDGGRWRARGQVADVAHDLCLLDVPAIHDGAVTLGQSTALQPGQGVTGVGYTGGAGIQTSGGDVVALHPFDGASVIQSSTWFNSGASGGGLFDDQAHLVGILTFRLRGGAAHYFAAPAEWVRALLAGGQAGEPVGPIATPSVAFWQRPAEAQPEFLKAAVLERDRDWPGLETLTRSWLRRAPGDAEPWYLQGMALAQQDRLPDARDSLERSVELQPAFPPAWFRLGVVYSRLGLRERADDALSRLRALNTDLATELTRLLGGL